MRSVIKYIVAKTYKPLLVKYLSGHTVYTYNEIRLHIPPEVFHPGFFFSTKILLKYISRLALAQKSFLELGAGSGLISIYAAKRGSLVTATDISPVAVDTLKRNKVLNNVHIDVIESDVFGRVPWKEFDIMVINPPYYKKDPLSIKDYAWYCGKNGEFFDALFRNLSAYVHEETQALMILCDSCDLEMIEGFAQKHAFKLNCVFSRKNILETNYIYKIERTDA